MGYITMELELSIGEVILGGNGYAMIPCCLPKSSTLNLIVQDKLGRAVLDKAHQLDADNQEIQFNTSNLKPGDYHAWVYLNDMVFVRSFHVDGEKNKGLLENFFSRFR